MRLIRNLLYLILIIAVFTFGGCRSKKELTTTSNRVQIDTVYRNVTQTDTVIKEKRVEITKPIYYETVIDCDSLNASGKIQSGGNTFNYTKRDGKVVISAYIDSTRSSLETEYRNKYVRDSLNLRKQLISEFSEVEKIKVYVYPWWVWVLGLGILFFAALWVYERFFLPKI